MRSRITPGPARRSGFTFLEIILVVAIIGILAGIVGPRLVGRSKKAKIQAARAHINSIKTALGTYEVATGSFPTSAEGIKALVERPASVPENDWEKTLERVPKDPWGEDFIYVCPSAHGGDYDVMSKGPDRQEGTADDINSWEDSSKENL